MQYLRVKNWESFQHYKDRSPPWIKLHRDLLRDYNFICLQDASKMQLMLIWLLASQVDNKIPADPEYIKNQIGIKGELNLSELIEKGFLVDDSNTLAECKQSAIVETEAETYSTDREEIELPKSAKAARAKKTRLSSDWILPDEWGEWALEEGLTHEQVVKAWPSFRDYHVGKGTLALDWKATWRTWIYNIKNKGW